MGVKYERKLCRIVDIYNIVTLFAYAIINKMLLREHDILHQDAWNHGVKIFLAWHSMLNLNGVPINVFRANSMLVSIKKSWGIIPIQQKFDTMAAIVDSENCQNQISIFQPENEYYRADLLLCKSKSAQWK